MTQNYSKFIEGTAPKLVGKPEVTHTGNLTGNGWSYWWNRGELDISISQTIPVPDAMTNLTLRVVGSNINNLRLEIDYDGKTQRFQPIKVHSK